MVTPVSPAEQAGPSQGPRAQFLDGLSPRLNTLSAMVEALASDAASRATGTESLVRRLRAMRAAADAVGLEEVGSEFDAAAAGLATRPWSETVRGELHAHLDKVARLGQVAAKELADARPSGAVPVAPMRARQQSTPVGPFTVVALASESQKVILRQALEQAEEFNLYCSQDAGEASALLATYDPDLFVVDGRRSDVTAVIAGCDGCPVMVVDARAADVERYKEGGARWVTTIGEHYETELLEGLRHRRRSQSMIAPRGDGVMTLSKFAEEVAEEIKQALLKTATGHNGEAVLALGEGTSVQTSVWSMLARLRDTVTELSHGTVKYDPHTPSGAMIVTGKDAMRRGGRTRASAENLAGRKILVAEDDTSVGWYLTSLLRGKGAIVTEASDGLEALRQARRDAPDLVICDVMLPALDGFALCRNLKHDVALSDVPVILLSWKEDLLQRVRELGAGADGYLAKEAEASVIVERCAEALEPRARIEKRLLTERVVHGRLDGVTPRLVLQLASRAVDNAKVVLQDAAFQYEVCLGDGRILTARRKAADGSVESGEKVLPGLLGMRAGRFTVERVREPVQAELYGSVDKVLAPFIERARRAIRRLKGADLYDVARLEIDGTALGPYLSVSPPIVNKVVTRLREGTSPADLLHSVSASLLESVLEDLALRGGILQVISSDGEDVLEEEQRDSVAAFDMELRSAKAVHAASAAPVIGPGSSAEEAAAAADYAGEVNEAKRPSNRPSYAPVVVPGPGRSSAGGDNEPERRSSLPPGDARATVLGLAPEAPRPERNSALPPLPQATLSRDDDAPRGQNGTPTVRPPAARGSVDDTPPSGMQWAIPETARVRRGEILPASLPEGSDPEPEARDNSFGQTLGGWTPLEARVSRREEAGRVGLTPSEPSDVGIDLAEAVVGFGATPGPAPVEQAVVRRPVVKVLSGAAASEDATFGGARGDGHTLTGLGAMPSEPAGRPNPDPAVNNLQDSWRAPSLVDGKSGAAKSSPVARSLPELAPAPVHDTFPGDPPTNEVSTPAVGAAAPNRVIDLGSTVELGPGSDVNRSFDSNRSVDAVRGADLNLPVRPLAPPSPLPPKAEPPRQDAEPPRQDAGPSREAQRESDPPSVRSRMAQGNDEPGALRRVAGVLRPMLVVTAAAMGAFVGMNHLAKWVAPESERQTQVLPSQPATAGSAPNLAAPLPEDLMAAPPGEEKVQRKTEAKVSDLDLPEGLTVPAGKGLLEVDSGGQHKLYVDNVFVGRGPLRRIPIDPGTHQVQTQLDGVEEVHSVPVTAGRRARLELTESGK